MLSLAELILEDNAFALGVIAAALYPALMGKASSLFALLL